MRSQHTSFVTKLIRRQIWHRLAFRNTYTYTYTRHGAPASSKTLKNITTKFWSLGWVGWYTPPSQKKSIKEMSMLPPPKTIRTKIKRKIAELHPDKVGSDKHVETVKVLTELLEFHGEPLDMEREAARADALEEENAALRKKLGEKPHTTELSPNQDDAILQLLQDFVNTKPEC